MKGKWPVGDRRPFFSKLLFMVGTIKITRIDRNMVSDYFDRDFNDKWNIEIVDQFKRSSIFSINEIQARGMIDLFKLSCERFQSALIKEIYS